MNNTIKTNYLKILDEYIAEPLFITDKTSELQKELDQNYWWIDGTREQINSLTLNEWKEFLEKLIADRQNQLTESSVNTDLIFYCYHDQQAGQLRFNVISAAHNTLPFAAAYKEDSMERIISSFLDDGQDNLAPIDDNYRVGVYMHKLIKKEPK